CKNCRLSYYEQQFSVDYNHKEATSFFDKQEKLTEYHFCCKPVITQKVHHLLQTSYFFCNHEELIAYMVVTELEPYRASQDNESANRPTYYKNYMNAHLIVSHVDDIWNDSEKHDNDILTIELFVRGFYPNDPLPEHQITEADIIQSENLDMIQPKEYTKENFQQVAATNMYPKLLEAICKSCLLLGTSKEITDRMCKNCGYCLNCKDPNPKEDLTHRYCL
ncbi:5930_t:CDS:2, partial [Racocetra persica]